MRTQSMCNTMYTIAGKPFYNVNQVQANKKRIVKYLKETTTFHDQEAKSKKKIKGWANALFGDGQNCKQQHLA